MNKKVFKLLLLGIIFLSASCVQMMNSSSGPLPPVKSADIYSYSENIFDYDMKVTNYSGGRKATEIRITPKNYNYISGQRPFKVYDHDGDGNFEWLRVYSEGKEFNYRILPNGFGYEFNGLSPVSNHILFENLRHAQRAREIVPKKGSRKRIHLS